MTMLKTRSLARIAVCFALAAFLSVVVGCAHTPGGIAPSTTPINGRSYDELGQVTATDSYILLFGILPIKGSNSTSVAVDSAIRKVRGADALINVTVDTYFQWFIILSRQAIEVRGTAIRFTDDG
jgi:hypothetical protein